jgi:hypothetical protein
MRTPQTPTSHVAPQVDFGGDEKRRAWHEKKMASKVARPAAQLGALGIAAADAGEVLHFDFNEPPAWYAR